MVEKNVHALILGWVISLGVITIPAAMMHRGWRSTPNELWNMSVWTASGEMQEVPMQPSKSKATMAPFHQGRCILTWTCEQWTAITEVIIMMFTGMNYENGLTVGATVVKMTSRLRETKLASGAITLKLTSMWVSLWSELMDCWNNIPLCPHHCCKMSQIIFYIYTLNIPQITCTRP